MSIMRNRTNDKTDGVRNMDIKLYTRRWFLLFLFIWFSSDVSLHWTQFSSISNVVSRYYSVPGIWAESTAMMCMAARSFVFFPALFLIDKLETRNTLILASSLSLIGSSIKAFSVVPDRFYVVLIGQVFSALSVTFTYSLVGRFSSAWFSSSEISMAGALCCVGDQMGGAFGFLLPNLFVPDSVNEEDVARGMQRMHYFYVGNAFVTLVLILIFFKSKPKYPPSAAQVHSRSNKTQRVFKSVKKNLRNPNFVLFLFSHALVNGVGYNGFVTLLNEMIVINFPGYAKHTGPIGCLNLLSGVIGSLVVSYILDKTRKFKGNSVALSTITCIYLPLCGVSMKMGNILYVYISYTIFGFFLMAYFATGFQMGIELTFPVPEGITIAIMSVCIEFFSVISTALFGISVRKYGDFESTMGMTCLIFLSTIAVCLVPARFRREELERAAKSTELKEFLPGEGKKLKIIQYQPDSKSNY